MRKGKIEGYFTLEAALILPMVLAVISFILYLLFFQYNRCLMEQDMGILALRGALMQVENHADRVQQLQEMAEQQDWDKYLAWEMEEVTLTAGRGKVTVMRKGQIRTPFRKEGKESWWSTVAGYENHILSPEAFVRICHRLLNSEKENEEFAEEKGE